MKWFLMGGVAALGLVDGFRGFGSADLHFDRHRWVYGVLLPRRWRDLPSCNAATARTPASLPASNRPGGLRSFNLNAVRSVELLNSASRNRYWHVHANQRLVQFTDQGARREPACGLLASTPTVHRRWRVPMPGITNFAICAVKRRERRNSMALAHAHDGPGDGDVWAGRWMISRRFRTQPGEQARRCATTNV